RHAPTRPQPVAPGDVHAHHGGTIVLHATARRPAAAGMTYSVGATPASRSTRSVEDFAAAQRRDASVAPTGDASPGTSTLPAHAGPSTPSYARPRIPRTRAGCASLRAWHAASGCRGSDHLPRRSRCASAGV